MATNKVNSGTPPPDFDTEQPHAFWQGLRESCPVSAAATNTPDKRPLYYVSSWAEANTVLGDPETFSSSINAEGTAKFMGPTLLAMDGEQHKSRRAIIAHAFRSSQLAKWEHSLVIPVISGLCDAIADVGRAELVEQVLSRFPVLVICGMCSIPPQDSPKFLHWAKAIHRGMRDPAVGLTASAEMRAYLEPLVEDRRSRPGDDLISDIVHAEVDGKRLDDDEIYGFLRLLLPAGSESTFRAISSALLMVLVTPGLLARVNADRSHLAAVIEETLRWDVANSMVSRVATRDTTLGGCTVPSEAALLVLTNSANRDEKQFDHAASFDPDRPQKRHIGFGRGPHQCLGQPLARIEMRAGLEIILDKLPNLRLDPDHAVPVIQGASFRGASNLHVLFGPV